MNARIRIIAVALLVGIGAAVMLAGCAAGFSFADSATAVMRQTRVETSVWMVGDSLCNEIVLTNPYYADTSGNMIPIRFLNCWPLVAPDTVAVDSLGPIGSLGPVGSCVTLTR